MLTLCQTRVGPWQGAPCAATNTIEQQEFRLKPKEFLLTSSSGELTCCEKLCDGYGPWVKAWANFSNTTQWSAAVEQALRSATKGKRAHVRTNSRRLGTN